MEKKKLIRKTIASIIVLALILMVGSGIVVALIDQRNTIDNYRDLAYSYTRTAASLIDGDKIAQYLETGETDDYYDTIRQYMNAAAKEAGIMYFYVVVPTEEDMIYIWDAEPEEVPLGFLEHDEYSEGGKENTMRALSGEGKDEFPIYLDAEWYVATAMTPLYDRNGKAVAVIGADISFPGIWRSALADLVTMLGAIILIMVVAMVLYYFRVRKQIIIPIATLKESAGELVSNLENETEFEIPLHTNDEFDDLARTYETMAGTIRSYIQKNEQITAEKERISTELDLATRIQADMLPSIFPPFPERREFDIYASMTPAKEVGGDFYDYYFVEEDLFAFLIADVSGKGVPAALFMMMSMILINDYTMMKKNPAEVLMNVNQQICSHNNEEMFVTVWLGLLDLKTGVLTAANAGHEYPALKKPDGSFEILKGKHGFVVGGMEDITYKEYELKLEKGSKLFLYTDGVPEAANAEDEQFGLERMLDTLNSEKDGTPEEIISAIHKGVDAFVGEAEQFDDLTVLCLEYHGSSPD